jgi:putative AlgH/UPF0301 family transcriptional regulator
VFFAVRLTRGGPWDFSRELREQDGWEEHSRYMDALVDEAVVVLGGPLDGDREVLLAVKAESAEQVRERLADDVWIEDGRLTIAEVTPWTILLDGR